MAKAQQEVIELDAGVYFGFTDLNVSRLVLSSRSNLEVFASSNDSRSVRFKRPSGRLKRNGSILEVREMLQGYRRVYASYKEYVEDMKLGGNVPLPDPSVREK